MTHIRFMRAFTLIELMVTIVVLGIVLFIAVPNFYKFVIKQEVKSQTSELALTLMYARSEAMKLQKPIAVVPMKTSNNDRWVNGWCVVPKGKNCSNTSDVLRQFEVSSNHIISSQNTQYASTQLVFTARGSLESGTGFITLQPDSNDKNLNEGSLRCIDINRQGRARVLTASDTICQVVQKS